MSAYILCVSVHPFKISARPLKGLPEPLVSVGFPRASLGKYTSGMMPASSSPEEGCLVFSPSGVHDREGYRSRKAMRWRLDAVPASA